MNNRIILAITNIKSRFTALHMWIKENQKRENNFKEIKTIITILGAIFLTLILWSNRVNLYPDNVYLWAEDHIKSLSIGSHFPAHIQGEKISTENLQINDGYIVALSDSTFNVFSKSGKILQQEKHNFSHPNIQSAGRRHIIFDRGGKNFKICSNTRTLHSASTEQNILTACIATNGSYALVTQSPRYLAELSVYNKNNALKFKLPFSEYYITNVAINSTANEISLSGISSYNGDIISNVYVIDVPSKSIKSQFELSDNMVTDIKYFANGMIIAIGDKYSAFVNPKSKSVIKKDYENKVLKFYDFDRLGNVCLCLSSSHNESSKDTLLKMDEYAKETLKIDTEYSFTDVIMKNDKIVGITKDKILVYNMWGACNGYINSEKFYRKILPAPHNNIYALSSCDLFKIKLSGLKSQ